VVEGSFLRGDEMKAAFIKKTGGPSVIEYGDLPDPKPKDNQLLIKVIAVAPAPVDAYIRSGKYQAPIQLPQPYILGRDMVGEVVAIGSEVSEFEVGQQVWSVASGEGEQGVSAELVARDADLCHHLPKGIDPIQAVACIQAATTACRGIIVASNLKRDGILFVNGASGNVGTALIQLGKARGAIVFASTSSKEKIEWCKAQGADAVFDHDAKDFTEQVKQKAPSGIDAFWDTSQQPNIELGTTLLGRGGTIILFAGSQSKPVFPVGPFYSKELGMKGFTLFHSTPEELSDYAMIVNRAFEEGLLRPKIAATLPLKEMAKAHAMLEAKPPIWGKIVLTVNK